jgi:putative ABC transport system substrate-binding protein
MRRREFILGLGGAAAWPVLARAQHPDRVRRIGVLSDNPDNPLTRKGYPILIVELRKLGFVEGENLSIEYRRIDEGTAKAFAGANELVAAKAEVLVTIGPELSLEAAQTARPALPIVFIAVNFDPIAKGYVTNLARPGGNLTGLFFRQPELAAKQLEFLAEAFPDRKVVAVLWDQFSADQFEVAERVASAMGLSLRPLKLEKPPYDWDTAFRTAAQNGSQALLVLSGPFFGASRERIASLAMRYRLPAMFTFDYYVEAGGLISYGVNVDPPWRRAASYVAKILRGASPADLPVEQITNYELAINLKTAKAIGVTLPTSILLRADEVIE